MSLLLIPVELKPCVVSNPCHMYEHPVPIELKLKKVYENVLESSYQTIAPFQALFILHSLSAK
jgi:hypothetical protein